jgi:hypothetical protein
MNIPALPLGRLQNHLALSSLLSYTKNMSHLRPIEKSRASGMEHHCSLEE